MFDLLITSKHGKHLKCPYAVSPQHLLQVTAQPSSFILLSEATWGGKAAVEQLQATYHHLWDMGTMVKRSHFRASWALFQFG